MGLLFSASWLRSHQAVPCLLASAVAGLLAKVAAKSAWGFEGQQPPALQKFAVELDQRLLTELAHTAALFSELFEPSGRKKLLKVTTSVTTCANDNMLGRSIAGLLAQFPFLGTQT